MISEGLKQRILLRTGLTAIRSRDCKWITAEIRHSLNRHISVTTVKRVFGFARSKHHFSKYTIATLDEYVSLAGPNRMIKNPMSKDLLILMRTSYLSTSKLLVNMDILSFITDDPYLIYESDVQPCLHPEQLAIHAIKILMKDNHESLPICENGKCLGMVYTDELRRFINYNDKEDQLIFHKINFDLKTAITIMHRNDK